MITHKSGDMEFSIVLVDSVRRELKTRGWSCRFLAQIAGIPRSTLQRYLSIGIKEDVPSRGIPIGIAFKISICLGVSLSDMLDTSRRLFD